MAEKTPRELLRESLERNAAQVAAWPDWLRRTISTESIFSVPSRTEASAHPERRDAAPVTEPSSEG